MLKIGVIGCGYVGLVSGGGLADFGNDVVCIDIDRGRIGNLRNMVMPFFEPGLSELIKKYFISGKLKFADNVQNGIKGCDAVLIAVQTPQSDDGTADLTYLMGAAADVAESMDRPLAVIIKSTVPVGTANAVKALMTAILNKRGKNFPIDIISNPEFLREGSAVETFLRPDRIIIGCSKDGNACRIMKEIYQNPVEKEIPLIICSNETAETIKYASNAFLAMKISYINQMALLCEKTGADIKAVAKAVGGDSRINPRFLNPGPGYGGSCFPKDTRALVKTGEKYGVDLSLIRAAYEANVKHKEILAGRILKIMKETEGGTLAVWGLSFKAGTGDMRNSPALSIIPELISGGIKIKAYDPKAIAEAKRGFKDGMQNLELCGSMDKAVENSDGLLILTEWDCFRKVELHEVAGKMNKKILFDFRNLYDEKTAVEAGFTYYSVGR